MAQKGQNEGSSFSEKSAKGQLYWGWETCKGFVNMELSGRLVCPVSCDQHWQQYSEMCHHDMQQQRLDRALRRDKQRQKRILDSGIDYDYKPLEAAVPPKAKHTRLE